MTTDREQIIAAAKDAGFNSQELDWLSNTISRLYAIAFEAGRKSVNTEFALAEAYRCGEEAGRQAEREEIVKDLLPPITTPQTKAHYIANEISEALCKAIRARGESK